MEVAMTNEFRRLTPEEIRDIVARAQEARTEFIRELFRSAYVTVKGWFHRAPAPKSPRPRRHGPLAGANA
jgi:hypothetical protein